MGRTNDLVPSAVFDNDLFDTVDEVASYLDGAIGSLSLARLRLNYASGRG